MSIILSAHPKEACVGGYMSRRFRINISSLLSANCFPNTEVKFTTNCSCKQVWALSFLGLTAEGAPGFLWELKNGQGTDCLFRRGCAIITRRKSSNLIGNLIKDPALEENILTF